MTKIVSVLTNSALLVLIGLGVLVVFSLVPLPGKLHIYVVQSGSMEPAIRTGSIIFVRPAAPYTVGDIITHSVSETNVTVTHRVVAVEPSAEGALAYRTKGDANNAQDSDPVPERSIVGKVLFPIPWLGYAVNFAKTKIGFVLVVLVPAIYIAVDEIRKLVRAYRSRRINDADTYALR